jgi:hypothetical protein
MNCLFILFFVFTGIYFCKRFDYLFFHFGHRNNLSNEKKERKNILKLKF